MCIRDSDVTVEDVKAAEQLDCAIKLIAWYHENPEGAADALSLIHILISASATASLTFTTVPVMVKVSPMKTGLANLHSTPCSRQCSPGR